LTGYLERAGFGVRVAFCAVATVLLVLVFRGSGGPVNQARGASAGCKLRGTTR